MHWFGFYYIFSCLLCFARVQRAVHWERNYIDYRQIKFLAFVSSVESALWWTWNESKSKLNLNEIIFAKLKLKPRNSLNQNELSSWLCIASSSSLYKESLHEITLKKTVITNPNIDSTRSAESLMTHSSASKDRLRAHISQLRQVGWIFHRRAIMM